LELPGWFSTWDPAVSEDVFFDVCAVLGGELAAAICRDDGGLEFHQLVEEIAVPR
jgi:hypothetical protein